MSARETIVATRTVHDGRTIVLRVHDVRLEDGRDAKREIVEHRGAVAIAAITPEGRLLLVKQFRLAAGEVMLELPAGTLDPGEDPRAAAERELEEETGMRAGSLTEIGSFYVSPGWCTERITVFEATGLIPSSQNLDEDESVEVISVPFEEAIRMVRDGVIHDAKSVTGILLAAERRRES